MKMFKSVSMVLGLTCVILSSQVMAKSGNGDSYSGPTLSGDAVALSIDKPIFVSQFFDVANKCLLKDPKDNLIKEFFDNYYQRDITYKNLKHWTEELSGNYSYGQQFGMKTGYNIEYKSDQIRLAFIGNTMTITLYRAIGPELVLSIPNFPVFKISSIESANVYNPITGELVRINQFLKDLQVVYDRSLPGYEAAINVETKKKTQLLFPVGEFTDCMINGLGSL